jgi:hypothetical protein
VLGFELSGPLLDVDHAFAHRPFGGLRGQWTAVDLTPAGEVLAIEQTGEIKGLEPDAAEGDFLALIELQADEAGLALEVAGAEDDFAVEADCVAVAAGGDVEDVPASFGERRALGGGMVDEASGGELWMFVPDLEFVAGFPRVAIKSLPEEDAGVGVGSRP